MPVTFAMSSKTTPRHPPTKGALYVVLMQIGKVKGEPTFDPLAYGLPGQPWPDQLLRRGSRATGFASERQAWQHLEKSAQKWNAGGLVFHRGKIVRVLKVERFVK